MASTFVQVDEPIALPAEWWERVAGLPAAWLTAHPVAAGRWARVRAIGLWVALVWVLVLLLVVPDVRASVRAYAASFVLVVVWFLLARTKTLSWSSTARLFTVCVAWSGFLGWFTLQVAGALDLLPGADGAGIALAGFLEESGKLVPLLVLVIAAPGRVRRFAAVDWALVGFASGAAFNAYEDAVRQIAAQDPMTALFWGDSSKTYTLNPWESGRFLTADGVAVGAGHHIWTAMTAMSIGLGIAWWRSGRRGGRLGAVVLPVVTVVLAIAEHASFNARSANSTWPGEAGPGFSSVLRVLWSITGHGRASTVISVLMLVACLLVDVQRRHRAALIAPAGVDQQRPGGAVSDAESGLGAVAWWQVRTAPVTATSVPPRPTFIRTSVFVLVGAGTVAIRAAAQWGADIAVVLAAHTRASGEPRRDAVARGRVVTTKVRTIRVEAMTITMPGPEPRARRRFALIGAVLGVVALVVCLWWGAHMATSIGTVLITDADTSYLAGLLDRAGDWWNGLNGWQQVAVGAGIAALVVLSGGSLGLAVGASGVATYGLTKAHGAATFTRDPLSATTSYLATTTPAEFLLDTGEFALTFAPGNFAGAAAGKGVRILTEEIARDPAAFLAAQRAIVHSDAGIVTPELFFGRRTVELADGTTVGALSQADQATDLARYNDLPASRLKSQGPAADFQVGIYGNNERLVILADDAHVYPDGFTPQYGAIGDAKFVARSDRSFYVPETMGARFAPIAVGSMDKKLVKLAEAARALGGNGTIELTTNNIEAAQFIEARMRALGLHGYVRVIN